MEVPGESGNLRSCKKIAKRARSLAVVKLLDIIFKATMRKDDRNDFFVGLFAFVIVTTPVVSVAKLAPNT